MKMRKNKNKLPDFSKMTREEEAKFWDTHSFAEYWDELKDVDLEVDLKKNKDETLVLRMQKGVKDKLEQIAQSKGLNVSTLARMWIIEKLQTL